MNLLNLIARSTVHLVIMDKATHEPVRYGSGCVVKYRNKLIVLSVDHVTRIRGLQTYALIETGGPAKDGQISWYSTGGLVCFDQFKLEGIGTGDLSRVTISEEDPLDVTFTAVKDDIVLMQKGFIYYGEEIEGGQKVFPVLDYATLPDAKEEFGFCGFIKHDIFGKTIKSDITIKLGLSYRETSDGFHLFNTPDLVTDIAEYEGTSGSPIFDFEGRLVGLVCIVLENSRSVWAFPIDYCRRLIDIAIDSGLI